MNQANCFEERYNQTKLERDSLIEEIRKLRDEKAELRHQIKDREQMVEFHVKEIERLQSSLSLVRTELKQARNDLADPVMRAVADVLAKKVTEGLVKDVLSTIGFQSPAEELLARREAMTWVAEKLKVLESICVRDHPKAGTVDPWDLVDAARYSAVTLRMALEQPRGPRPEPQKEANNP